MYIVEIRQKTKMQDALIIHYFSMIKYIFWKKTS